MNEKEQQFVEDMGQLMVGWGLPRTTGRIYGYLLLQERPVTLDQMSAELEVAKSGVSVAVRQLLGLGLARGSGQRGSRRLLYEALFDLDAILAARNAQMLAFIDRLQQGTRAAASAPARQRIAGMAEAVQDCMDAINATLGRVRARRSA